MNFAYGMGAAVVIVIIQNIHFELGPLTRMLAVGL
jgi:hypothetical protein